MCSLEGQKLEVSVEEIMGGKKSIDMAPFLF